MTSGKRQTKSYAVVARILLTGLPPASEFVPPRKAHFEESLVIDISRESMISLSEAAKSLPRRRAGRKPNIATLYRWTTVGCRGVVLEFLQIGGTRCTSREAMQRFFDALTAQADSTTVPLNTANLTRLSASRRKQIEAAEHRLAEAGI